MPGLHKRTRSDRLSATGQTGTSTETPGQRADIQVLRAVAVGTVVLYHLWPNRLTGGFVGVDIFFTISGFLIGAHLVGELNRDGTIRLGRFWARRARRLLPASLLVLLVVAVATWTVVPLSGRRPIFEEVLGSTFYVQNWVLAGKSVDYLASEQAPSPVQHFWSLSVEEQFYVTLPLLMLLVALACRNRPALRSWILRGVVIVLLLASVTYSALLTVSNPGVAYFSTATRAWEFLAGVALAMFVPRWSRGLGTLIGWIGLICIVVAAVTYSQSTAFPGLAAALPVIGAAAALSTTTGPFALAGRMRPLVWIGDLSYAIYLWHWPLLVLLPYVTGVPLRTVDKLLIGLATLLLAWATTRYLEDPIRFSSSLLAGRRPRAIGGWMLAATCLVASCAFVLDQDAQSDQAQLTARAERLLSGSTLTCLGAGLASAAPGCDDLGETIVPDPSVVNLDDVNRVDCWARPREESVNLCAMPLQGESRAAPSDDPPVRVLAIGDSHNNALLPAYEQMHRDLGWQIEVGGHAGCGWLDPESGIEDPNACEIWRGGVRDHLDESEPYDIIITTIRSIPNDPSPARQQEIVDRIESAWKRQIDRGTTVVAIRGNPFLDKDVVACVERERASADQQCDRDRAGALSRFDPLIPAVDQTPGSALVDLTDLQCGKDRCSPVIGNVAVYRDGTHMSASFVRTLAPALIDRVADAVEDSTRRAD
ncbi:acyltransferase family protein [Aeromicrobium sp. CF3.5]|uniref:acyltransferase family protein n=1 Tax=Aeromicrobium sp. CF3.5 TaxID=3373078 RepID=UPI003EE4D9C0